jgi:hypothetical protein
MMISGNGPFGSGATRKRLVGRMTTHRLSGGMVHDGPDSPESRLVGGAIQKNPEKVVRANPITYVTGG